VPRKDPRPWGVVGRSKSHQAGQAGERGNMAGKGDKVGMSESGLLRARKNPGTA
jgi:hypothetical protein